MHKYFSLKSRSLCRSAVRQFSARHARSNFYDLLEVKPNATPNEIKAAYYRLSMKYHPDRNKGSETALRTFQQISAAYDTLCNESSRMQYDEEVLGKTYRTRPDRDTKSSSFYRSRQVRTKPGYPTGRSPIYNFDEFYRQHYGDAVRSHKERKAQYEEQQTGTGERQRAVDVASYVLVGLIVALISDYLFHRPSYDVPTSSNKEAEKR